MGDRRDLDRADARPRSRRDDERDRSASRGRSEDGIATHGELGRAFRARARVLGLPPTCVFAACFRDGCTKQGCADCRDLAPYDRAKHGALLNEMRRRLTDTYAAAVRWRDAG